MVKWVVFATIEAEELGIDQTNVADTAASSANPVVQRFLGVTPEGAEPFESGLGLEADWVVDVISEVGNYARDLRPEPRSMHAVRPRPRAEQPVEPEEGGLLYAPPYR